MVNDTDIPRDGASESIDNTSRKEHEESSKRSQPLKAIHNLGFFHNRRVDKLKKRVNLWERKILIFTVLIVASIFLYPWLGCIPQLCENDLAPLTEEAIYYKATGKFALILLLTVLLTWSIRGTSRARKLLAIHEDKAIMCYTYENILLSKNEHAIDLATEHATREIFTPAHNQIENKKTNDSLTKEDFIKLVSALNK